MTEEEKIRGFRRKFLEFIKDQGSIKNTQEDVKNSFRQACLGVGIDNDVINQILDDLLQKRLIEVKDNEIVLTEGGNTVIYEWRLGFEFNEDKSDLKKQIYVYNLKEDVQIILQKRKSKFIVTISKNMKAYNDTGDLASLRVRKRIEREANIKLGIKMPFSDVLNNLYEHTKTLPTLIEEEVEEYPQEIIQKACELVRDQQYLYKVIKLLDKSIVGEKENKLKCFIECCARNNKPKWIFLTGPPSGGKDTIGENVTDLFNEKDVEKAYRFTEHGLEYNQDWKDENDVLVLDGKIIFVPEAEFSKKALRMLRPVYGKKGKTYIIRSVKEQSEQKILVKGQPVVISGAVVPDMDDQDLARFDILSIDETVDQTQNIHEKQKEERRYPTSQLDEDFQVVKASTTLHDPELRVLIPFADLIEFPKELVRFRRDLLKFLDDIENITYTLQFQREIVEINDRRYVLSTFGDLCLAIHLFSKHFAPGAFNLPPAYYSFYEDVTKKFNVGEEDLDVEGISEKTGKSEQTVRNYMNFLKKRQLVEKYKKPGEGRKVYYRLIPTSKKFLETTLFNFIGLDKRFGKKELEEWLKSIQPNNSDFDTDIIYGSIVAPFFDPIKEKIIDPLNLKLQSYIDSETGKGPVKQKKLKETPKLEKVRKEDKSIEEELEEQHPEYKKLKEKRKKHFKKDEINIDILNYPSGHVPLKCYYCSKVEAVGELTILNKTNSKKKTRYFCDGCREKAREDFEKLKRGSDG